MPRRDLRDKRVIITGASSGIGRALSLEAARCGMKVLAAGRDEERLGQTQSEARRLGGQVETLAGDLTDPDFRQRLIQAPQEHWGGLDLLVNNAGIGATGHFQYARPDRLRTIMEINFFAPCELCRLAIPLLKAGTDPCIVMINSVAGRRAIPSRSEYSASKFALMGFSEALRGELAKDDVELVVVSPGLTESHFEENMIENVARHSLHAQRSMTAPEAAQRIWNAVESRRNETTLSLQGKLLVLASRFIPRFVDRKMAQFVRQLYADEIKARGARAAAL